MAEASDLLACFAEHEGGFVGIREEADLGEDAGHSRLTQYPEDVLTDATAVASSRAVLALDLVCQLDALVEVSILHKVKHDIALRRRRVKALVGSSL